jgi:hypothetical protein
VERGRAGSIRHNKFDEKAWSQSLVHLPSTYQGPFLGQSTQNFEKLLVARHAADALTAAPCGPNCGGLHSSIVRWSASTGGSIIVNETPTIDDVLRRAFAGVDDDDVRLFYQYFDELKGQVRKYLGRKAQTMPGESAVAHSALFSLFCNATLARLSLSEVDEYGYPALWPLLLTYVERHCNKWNKYYRAKKRKGVEVSLSSDDSSGRGIDPPDHRSAADDEEMVGATLESLYGRLTPRQRRVADLTAIGHTLEEIATALDCSESLVSKEKKAIRVLLETD